MKTRETPKLLAILMLIGYVNSQTEDPLWGIGSLLEGIQSLGEAKNRTQVGRMSAKAGYQAMTITVCELI